MEAHTDERANIKGELSLGFVGCKHALGIELRNFPPNLFGFFLKDVPLLFADDVKLGHLTLHQNIVSAL